MKEKHPVEELTKNYFSEYLHLIYGAYVPDGELGFQYDPENTDLYYSEAIHRSRQVLISTAKAFSDRIKTLTIDEQRDFIARIRRECDAETIPDHSEFIEKRGFKDDFGYGNFFSTIGSLYIRRYREIALNLSVVAPNTNTPQGEGVGLKNTARLNWVGNANTLYHLFGQLLNPPSGRPLIDNTAEDVVQFIKANFEGINANEKTIAAEISRHRTGAVKEPKQAVKLKKPEDT